MKQKIWIYIIEKELSESELQNLVNECKHFVNSWKSHEAPVQASVELYKNRLLIFRNNEDFNPIGGCATDQLFRFIQELEKKYSTPLLNRKLVVFEKNGKLVVENIQQTVSLIQNGMITQDTIVYNTAIISSDEWEEFRKPARESWLNKVLQMI
ncbi:MAG: hypothetical protein N2203_06300 [Bacteroidia bacterium]|nr:hypothetical protein [Bacteroidia bacterium]